MDEIATIGLDIGKRVLQVHAADARGRRVLQRKLRREEVRVFFAGLPPRLVGMEACATAHHWARELRALGHDVRLILAFPRFHGHCCAAEAAAWNAASFCSGVR